MVVQKLFGYSKYHMIAFALGFFLDLLFGDPIVLPHPVVGMGKLISFCDKKLRTDNPKKNRINGIYTVVIMLTTTLVITTLIIATGYYINPFIGTAIEAFMTFQALALKSLKKESMKVYNKLKYGTLEEARFAVSMIVGRDTANLNKDKVCAAAVETVAENTSDGVIAPLIYLALGGPVLGYLYKAINTMDSMIGYKNDKYIDFGRAAAKVDDFVNYIPSRISAYLMIAACFFLGKEYNAKNAFKIYKRDRYNHSSPNSAQTESVCAGSLGLRLAGPSSYFGKIVEKPFIGDELRKIELDDIKRVNKLLYTATFIGFFICVLIMLSLL